LRRAIRRAAGLVQRDPVDEHAPAAAVVRRLEKQLECTPKPTEVVPEGVGMLGLKPCVRDADDAQVNTLVPGAVAHRRHHANLLEREEGLGRSCLTRREDAIVLGQRDEPSRVH